MRVADLKAIRIKLASPEDVLAWSHGEVTKPETINYRTQRSEKDGLFCQKIFGPEKDYECYCGKYKRIRYKGIICDRCGVEVTKSGVRRERMGHIKLACPVSHIWFLRGVPSRMGMVLDIPMPQLERVIYFAAFIITKVDEEARKKVLVEVEKEYKQKFTGLKLKGPVASLVEGQKLSGKNQKPKTKGPEGKLSVSYGAGQTGSRPQKLKTNFQELKGARDRAREEILGLKPNKVLSELEYHDLSLKYGEIFEAGTGAETLRKIFEKADLKKTASGLKKELESTSPINRRRILRRLRLFQRMFDNGLRPEWMFLTMLPVLPPDLRPMVQLDGGRYASSDLNDLYRRVINRNNRLKYLLEIAAPEVIVRNEKRMLQEAVDALIDNGMRKGVVTRATTGGRRLLKSLADILEGKQGRFRQNLLGKRVDYSGRSVIVVGPELKLHQCGLPKKMALELFKPFVIKRLLDKELAYNVRGASRLIEEETDEIWASLEEVVKDKLVLLNRAPTLHRLGIQAFHPLLIEGEAIRVHPLVCQAFNADFDGDQMAVHLPLSEKAQQEAREIMLSSLNLLKPATAFPIVTPSKDIVLGIYWMTKLKEGAKGEGKIFANPKEALLYYEWGAVDLRARIKIRAPLMTVDKKPISADKKSAAISQKSAAISGGFIETSVGRIIFNESLPKDFPFQNDEINSRKLEKIVSGIIETYGIQNSQEFSDKIKDVGFEYATWSGFSWGIDDLIIPPEKEKIIQNAEKEMEQIESHFKKGFLSKQEKSNKVIEVWTKVKSEIEKLVPKTLPQDGVVFSIVDSGARGSWTQPVQMTGMKGLVINPVGKIIELPVKSCYKEGFDVLEYFISTHGARKGTADTALRTATAGYLTRCLIDVAHDVIVTEQDCKDKEGTEIWREDANSIGQNFLFKILGSVALEEIKNPKTKKQIVKNGEIIGREAAEEITEAGIEKVLIRSPLSCKTARGVCQTCYGWDLGKRELVKLGEAVGIVAAQSIGEPGTQLTMRTFHTGGVAGGGDITFGLPRVREVFEVSSPAGKAEISPVDGKVLEITPERIIKIKPSVVASASSFALQASADKLAGKKVPPLSLKLQRASKSQSKLQPEIFEFKIPPQVGIWVQPGQEIKRGQQLCEGSLDLRELLKFTDKSQVQRYIVKEIQRIYTSQRATIHDKHIVVIVRQMFSRVRVKKSGDSFFLPGEILERAKFLEENAALKKAGKTPALAFPILLGMSRVSLTTDSFLSAASFQETSRILIRAAVEGKEDKLRGLKENVIIGKLIPAGTGFRK